MICSRANPRIKTLAALQTRKGREEQGLAIAEGIHLCEEAFRSGAAVRTLILSESMIGRAEAPILRLLAEATGVEVLEVSNTCYAKLSDLQSPEGTAVVFAPRPPHFAELLAEPRPRLLVAAGVQDPGNAGALVRTAEAAGASGCVFLDSIDVLAPKFLRAAMGSAFRIPCCPADTEEFLERARGRTLRLLAAAAEAAPKAVGYDAADYAPPVALCVGGEGAGLPSELLASVATRIFIPMSGRVESLNVAVAAGILLYQARRAW